MTTEEIAFIEEEQKKARELTALDMPARARLLCTRHGCPEDERRKHVWLYLREQWQIHPSERFVRWWQNQGWKETETATDRGWSFLGKDGLHHPINVVTAYNCDSVREVYDAFRKQQNKELHRLKTGDTEVELQLEPERKDNEEDNNGDEEPIGFA